MAVVLILVAGLVVSSARAMRASRETAAAQNVATLANDEQAFQHAHSGYSPLATNLGGSENSATLSATFAADQEVPTFEATALDAGYTTSGYIVTYKSGATTFVNADGNTVSNAFEFTAIPNAVGNGTKSFCSDPSGSWYNELGTGATVSSGAGCKTDGYTAQ